MSTTTRDRRILIGLAILILAAGYWFLLFSPKQQEAAEAQEQAAVQQQRLDTALADIAQLEQAKTTYAADYSSVVHLGKAIPQAADTPSLLIQLQDAANGTGITFDSITAGDRAPIIAAVPQEDTKSLGKAAAEETGQAAPAGQTAPGTEPASGDPQGEVAGAREDTPAARQGAGGEESSAPGALEGIPLTFSFKGSFYGLADFFHEVKRFVRVNGEDIEISGRLLTIDKLNLTSDSEFPNVRAELGATAYLTPRSDATLSGVPGTPSAESASTEGSEPSSTPAAAVAP